MKQRILVSVISDVVTDQRVQKECGTLHRMGYDVLVLGRKSARQFGLDQLPFPVKRFANPFRRGPLMYGFFNLQLFFYLLPAKADILWSNDLDTLLANYWIARLRRKKLVYDSHEYFTESVYKKRSRAVWQRIERSLFPKLKNVLTVSDSLKHIYENAYGVPVTVLRNVPLLEEPQPGAAVAAIPPGKKILVMQGMGINEHRGAEEAVGTLRWLPGEFQLYFIGGGTLWNVLQRLVASSGLSDRVRFIPSLPYPEMMTYTRAAFLGLILEKTSVSDHHRYALPNKFFDYLQAGIPVLSTRVVEVERLIREYDVGDVVDRPDPQLLADRILSISADPGTYERWRANTLRAAGELNWQREEKVLEAFMRGLR